MIIILDLDLMDCLIETQKSNGEVSKDEILFVGG